MLRRRFILMATGGYRWLRAMVTAVVKRRADITAAQSVAVMAKRKARNIRRASPEGRPVGAMAAYLIGTAKRKAVPGSAPASAARGERIAKNGMMCRPEGVFIGWLFGARRSVTKMVAGLGSGIAALIETTRRTGCERAAKPTSEAAVDLTIKRCATVGLYADAGVGEGSLVIASLGMLCGSDAGTEAAAGTAISGRRAVKVEAVVEPAFWFYPEVDTDGALIIRQVYGYSLDGDVLEVM